MKWRLTKALIYGALSAFFAYAYYTRYWAYEDCIKAAKSSCITEDGANLTSGGMVWFFPSVFFAGLALWVLLRLGFSWFFKPKRLRE